MTEPSAYRQLLELPPALAVLTGPSGSGKTTVAEAYCEKRGAVRSVSATTRPPRSGERDGVDYHFMSDRRFDELIQAGKLAEWTSIYGGRRYGTLKRTIEAAQARGQDLLLTIDARGGAQIRARYPQASLVLLLPSRLTALERRLERRGTDSEEERKRRVQEALREIQAASFYDYVIENHDGEAAQAVELLEAVIEAERRKMAFRQKAAAGLTCQQTGQDARPGLSARNALDDSLDGALEESAEDASKNASEGKAI